MGILVYILGFICLMSLIVIFGIFARHWREIQLLNPESIQEEREKQKRDAILLQRFDRIRSEKIAPLQTVGKRLLYALKTRFHDVYIRLVRLERSYRQAKSPFAAMTPSVKDRLKLILNDARSLARDLKWAEAERRYLEALGIDSHAWDAYKGLGQIYLKQDLLPQATETYEFLLKSRMADDTVYAAIADIAERQKNDEKAESYRKKAIDERPRLANRHAELAEFYLNRKQADKAWPVIKRAVELDPKSSRYLELSLEAAILIGNRDEARRRYDKLRLLSQDRPKLHALKERIDELKSEVDN
ncbi:hypothetical protein IT408_01225 [Candidatus Uhrbacteria bacterium]|nr:hypothetical protein [Candidatus Uhrbacteria bacterium]